MYRKLVLLTMMLTLASILEINAQTAKVTYSGTVRDENGEPLAGAAVMIAGTKTGAVTDLDGRFEFSAVPGQKIVASYLGYVNAELIAGENTAVDFTLAPDSNLLEETIVVGYGTQSKRLISSSISRVKMDQIDRGAENDPLKALQGRVTGINISNSSGIPGTAPMVTIRGVSSLSGNSSPLYVVDGIPAESYPNINAADIENMEVLKDAAATAIYGSRANAGVIIITTKSGAKGRTDVDISGNYGFASIAKDIPMANTSQYINVLETAIDNYNVQMDKLKELYIPDDLRDFNWVGAISRKFALRGTASASVRGGTDKTQFFASIGAEQQQGYLNKTEFSKFTARVKLNQYLAKWLKLNINISGAYSHYDMIEETDGSLKVLRAAREEQPWYAPYCKRSINSYGKEIRENADYGDYRTMSVDGILRHNPVMCINEEDYYLNKYQLQGTISFDVTPFKGFKWTPSVSAYAISDKTTKKVTELNTERGYKDGWHALTQQKDNSIRYVIDNVISYNNEFDRLLYSLMAGHSYERYEYDTFGAASDNYANAAFPSSSFNLITSGNQIYPGSIGYNAYALESYFFRGSANWNNRYILNFSFRTDGSSRFPKENRYGFFPAGSLAWIISNEKFMPKTETLNELKLRLSAGQTGSMAGIGNWAAMNLVSAGSSYNGVSGLMVSSPAQNLKWEKSTKYNIGIDAEMLSNRLYFNIDGYYSRTDDMLYNRPVIATSGYTSLTSNIGVMANAGVELTIGGKVVDTHDVKWDLNANISYDKNKLVKLLDDVDIIPVAQGDLYGGTKHALIIGQPVSTWYMLKAEGIYQTDEEVPEKLYANGVRAGDMKYHDVNGDGYIDYDNDRMICGKATPDFFGGINSSLSWKGIELNLFCQFSVGGTVFAAWKGCGSEGTEHLGLSGGTITDDNGNSRTSYYNVSRDVALNYWRGEGTSNTIPRPLLAGAHTGWDVDYNILTSTRYLEDASYFKFKTLTLAYNLPQNILDRAKIKGLRLYFTIDNLYTITKYDGYDPEVSMATGPASAGYGTDFGYQPTLRSFLFGLQFKL